MKRILIYLSLILLISSIISLPHFKFDGLESYHQCLDNNKEIYSFTIYGKLSEEINSDSPMTVDDIFIDDLGSFSCQLARNTEKNSTNKRRQHKIYCSITGTFERKGYIINEPKVHGFDFLNKKGISTWPEESEKKTFLMGECGKKIELNTDPILKLSASGAYINPLDKVRNATVTKALSSLPARAKIDKNQMCTAMKKVQQTYSLTEGESAYLLYRWITANIKYDCYGLHHGGIDYTEDGTYSKGVGVCAGNSKLFVTMAKSLGLEAIYVIGYSKGAGFQQGVIPAKTDHAWNAVEIDSNYYLIDSTWGAGSCNGDTFEASYKEFYFCTPPEQFIKTHLPADSKYQYTDQTMTLAQFVSALKLSEAFYSYGFTESYPETSSFSATRKTTVILYHDPSIKNLVVFSHLFLVQQYTYTEQTNTCLSTKQKGRIDISIYTNSQGTYQLQIYGGTSGMKSFPELMTYEIKSSTNATTALFFPTTYNLYAASDIKIVSPLSSPLTQGKKISFKYSTTTYNNLYIGIGNSGYYMEMNKTSNGVFQEDDVYIFGSQVVLTTLANNSYQYIIFYSTVKDPKATTEATFPKAYSAPKNRLLSPLTDTLTKGKTYTFTIKCDSVSEIAVIEGGKFNSMKKSGSTFTLSYTVKGSDGQLKIGGYNSAKKNYSIYYIYTVK